MQGARRGPKITVLCATCRISFLRARRDVEYSNRRGMRLFCSKRCSNIATRKGERPCSRPDCDLPLLAKGLCSKHYWRLKKYGSAETLKKASPGDRAEWISAHVGHNGRDCLIFPFGIPSANSRGRATYKGRVYIASRLMCILAHGKPPSKRHLAAHRCGNGHDNCVNPQHLYWATPKQNMDDKNLHGTHNRGERHGNSKLRAEQVKAIRTLLKIGCSINLVARAVGVSTWAISHIGRRTTWGWLDD